MSSSQIPDIIVTMKVLSVSAKTSKKSTAVYMSISQVKSRWQFFQKSFLIVTKVILEAAY